MRLRYRIIINAIFIAVFLHFLSHPFVETIKHANIASGIVLELSTEASSNKLSFVPLSVTHSTYIHTLLQSNLPDCPANFSSRDVSCSALLVSTTRLQL